jgi:hypothetical protein
MDRRTMNGRWVQTQAGASDPPRPPCVPLEHTRSLHQPGSPLKDRAGHVGAPDIPTSQFANQDLIGQPTCVRTISVPISQTGKPRPRERAACGTRSLNQQLLAPIGRSPQFPTPHRSMSM